MRSRKSEILADLPSRRETRRSRGSTARRATRSRDVIEEGKTQGLKSLLARESFFMHIGSQRTTDLETWNHENDAEMFYQYYPAVSDQGAPPCETRTRLLAHSCTVSPDIDMPYRLMREGGMESPWKKNDKIISLHNYRLRRKHHISTQMLRRVSAIVRKKVEKRNRVMLDTTSLSEETLVLLDKFDVKYTYMVGKAENPLVLTVKMPAENRFPQKRAEKLALKIQRTIFEEDLYKPSKIQVEICESQSHKEELEHPLTHRNPEDFKRECPYYEGGVAYNPMWSYPENAEGDGVNIDVQRGTGSDAGRDLSWLSDDSIIG